MPINLPEQKNLLVPQPFGVFYTTNFVTFDLPNGDQIDVWLRYGSSFCLPLTGDAQEKIELTIDSLGGIKTLVKRAMIADYPSADLRRRTGQAKKVKCLTIVL